MANPQKGDFGARTETAITAGTAEREHFKRSLTANWRKGVLGVGILMVLIWGFSYIPDYFNSLDDGNKEKAREGRETAAVPARQVAVVELPYQILRITLKGDERKEVLVPPGQSLDYWFDSTQISTNTTQSGPDKIQNFWLKPGVDSASVYACRYRYWESGVCPAP